MANGFIIAFANTGSAMKKFICALSALLFLLANSLATYALEVGDRAPDFTLQASDGEVYTLSDYEGKNNVVIAWFPRAFSPGCTLECKSFAEHGYRLDDMEIVYFMASTDNLKRVVKFAQALDAEFPILSDAKKETAKKYGVLFLGMHSNRETYYINKNGIITHIDRDVVPESAAQDIIAQVQRLND